MCKRFLTVREANDLIPFLTDRLQRLRSTYKELESGREERTPPLQDLFSAGGMPVNARYFHLICCLQSLVSEIGAEGCEIKDLEGGLIDFPSLISALKENRYAEYLTLEPVPSGSDALLMIRIPKNYDVRDVYTQESITYLQKVEPIV